MARKYFARINGEQIGPLELNELIEAGVGPDTYIWHKGLPDWIRARQDGDVCRMCRNYLYDLAHPESNNDAAQKLQAQRAAELEKLPPLFRQMIEKDGTPFEMPPEKKEDYSTPPRSRIVEAILVTLFCSPLLGLAAIFFAYSAQKAWAAGQKEKAYDYTRKAKMWIGFSFFFGMIGVAIVLRSTL